MSAREAGYFRKTVHLVMASGEKVHPTGGKSGLMENIPLHLSMVLATPGIIR
jgi:hypothetical protein